VVPAAALAILGRRFYLRYLWRFLERRRERRRHLHRDARVGRRRPGLERLSPSVAARGRKVGAAQLPPQFAGARCGDVCLNRQWLLHRIVELALV